MISVTLMSWMSSGLPQVEQFLVRCSVVCGELVYSLVRSLLPFGCVPFPFWASHVVPFLVIGELALPGVLKFRQAIFLFPWHSTSPLFSFLPNYDFLAFFNTVAPFQLLIETTSCRVFQFYNFSIRGSPPLKGFSNFPRCVPLFCFSLVSIFDEFFALWPHV